MRGVSALREVPLFMDLDDAALALVAEKSRALSYPKGSIVFCEGDPGEYLLVILKGHVKVTLLGDDGRETIVAVLEAPTYLGEVALIEGTQRSATVVAQTVIEVVQIQRTAFLALVYAHPAIAVTILTHLAASLRRATEQIRSLSMFDVYGRVLRCLLIAAQQKGETENSTMILRPRPSVTQLASMSGCSRETVSRAMKTLLSTGYVSVIDRGLAIERRAIRQYYLPALQNLGSKS